MTLEEKFKEFFTESNFTKADENISNIDWCVVASDLAKIAAEHQIVIAEGVILVMDDGEVYITRPAKDSFGEFTYWLSNKNMSPLARFKDKKIKIIVEVTND